jgi:hypothetical protein
MSVFAQKDITSVSNINFYGVDFSHANLFGLSETPEAIESGLCRINNLFLSEAKKYNVEKYFKKTVLAYCLESVNKNNERMSASQLPSENKSAELSEEQIDEILSGLSCGKNDQTGLVFIAENLSKPTEKATYRIVFFDEKTKEIIFQKQLTGKPGGFGIRNFWAASVLKVMKDWKY